VQVQPPAPQTDVMDLLDFGGSSSNPPPQQTQPIAQQPVGNVLDDLFGGGAPVVQ
jgi:hypothetical protein